MTQRHLLCLLTLSAAACIDGGGDGKDTDTGASACDTVEEGDLPPVTLGCEAFAEPLVLSDSPDRKVDYFVDCTPAVTSLTIEPGTVVSFGEGAGLEVSDSSVLSIRGDVCAPVVLQGASAEPGYWRGLIIGNDDRKTEEPVVISHAEIRHAGGGAFNSNGDLGSIILWADSQLTIEDTLIADSAASGLNMSYGGSAVVMARNRFEDNAEHAILAEAEYADAMDGETTFSGNGTDGFTMYGGNVRSTGASWAATTAPYRALGVVGGTGPWTIEAGAEVVFEAGAGLEVYGDAVLNIAGTADAPVVLTGAEPSRGAWLGLIIDADKGSHRIAHTEIRYAGGGAFNSNGDTGGLIVWAGNTVTLQDTTIADSASFGLNLTYGDSTITLEGANTFTGNADAPVLLRPEYGDALSAASSYSGNDEDYVLVISETGVYGDNTWQALDVPWRLRSLSKIFYTVNIAEGDSLTFEAGAEVIAEEHTGFHAGEGALIVAGTEEAPVVFGPADGGTWRGFFFSDPRDDDATHSIDHAEIVGAGDQAFNSNGDLGAVVVWADTSASITNTIFRDTAAACAINASYSGDSVGTTGSTAASAQLLCDGD